MGNIEIRPAVPEDAGEILEIYRPYILKTSITFEYDVPSLSDFEQRMKGIMMKYPYLVAVREGKLIGYAYAHAYRERAAYGWDVETSIYLKMGETRGGTGTLLYQRLLELLKRQNVKNVYACITSPNEASERFHEKMGFRFVGVFPETGYKFGKWYGVSWYEKKIGTFEEGSELKPVVPVSEIYE
ncbi:MAG: N-acetyltransferase family protein [Candidatus Choladocola sp.]|nr:N-acetyltransferase family protein [Candidatus Choladocola sp.]